MILQANIGGYHGASASVFGYLDEDTQTLTIQAVSTIKHKRFIAKDGEAAGFISNQPLDECDYFFSEQDFKEAFKDYRFFLHSNKLHFMPKAQRATPQVEIDKIKESGSSFLVSSNITNENIAVIALVFLARIALNAKITLDMYEGMDFLTV